MSETDLKTVLNHLQALVGFDTQNPPRKIDAESGIFTYLRNNLPGFEFSIFDAGDGCLSLLAKRGNPKLLYNFHIDTVPVATGWTVDPFKLQIEGNKVTGLGACDIKGASACMLSAANQTTADVALLFSSDEEHGSSVAIKYFLKTEHGFTKVIVSEPTEAEAVLAHRGIQNAQLTFSGISGHASEKRALKDNAIHKSGQWMQLALNWVEQNAGTFETLSGLPFNIGTIEGGVKTNMIAASCDLAFGFRPLPGQSAALMLQELQNLGAAPGTKDDDLPVLITGFHGPTLPSANQDFDQAIENAKELANTNEIPIGNPVSYWTEASLFSEAGLTALVYGPGDIAQAHTADEWVTLEQLKLVEQGYINMLDLSQSKTTG